MIDTLLNLIAPHYCCSCGEIGGLLCDSCKHDIIDEDSSGCLLCGHLCGPAGVCAVCRTTVDQAWYVGERSGGLEALINRYKFGHAKAGFKSLGNLLLERLPLLPQNTVVVPVPTVRAHIRQRGYDHSLLLARYVAKSRGLSVSQPLVRVNTAMQRGAGRKQRVAQAKAAFEVRSDLRRDTSYLIIDDIVTTGSTLTYAAKTMRSAGASTVFVAAIARQPLENSRE